MSQVTRFGSSFLTRVWDCVCEDTIYVNTKIRISGYAELRCLEVVELCYKGGRSGHLVLISKERADAQECQHLLLMNLFVFSTFTDP